MFCRSYKNLANDAQVSEDTGWNIMQPALLNEDTRDLQDAIPECQYNLNTEKALPIHNYINTGVMSTIRSPKSEDQKEI